MTPVAGDWDPLFSDCADNEAFNNVGTRPGSTMKNGPVCSGVNYENNTPYLRTWRQYLGWGVLQDQAKAQDVIFCEGDSQNH